MLLWHATPARNLTSIRLTGLDPDRSRGRLRVIWLHTQAATPALVKLVATRHGIDLDQVVLIAVSVPRRRVRRFRRCLWYCADIISQDRLLITATRSSGRLRPRGVEICTWELPFGT